MSDDNDDDVFERMGLTVEECIKLYKDAGEEWFSELIRDRKKDKDSILYDDSII